MRTKNPVWYFLIKKQKAKNKNDLYPLLLANSATDFSLPNNKSIECFFFVSQYFFDPFYKYIWQSGTSIYSFS